MIFYVLKYENIPVRMEFCAEGIILIVIIAEIISMKLHQNSAGKRCIQGIVGVCWPTMCTLQILTKDCQTYILAA